jgi:hypothetical protein
VNTVTILRISKGHQFLDKLSDYQLLDNHYGQGVGHMMGIGTDEETTSK